MPRANIQILLTVLRDHIPKMCFPSLPIRSFVKMVARFIPAFFFWGFVLLMWRKSAGEAAVMQLSKYLCFQKGVQQGLQAMSLGRRRERSGSVHTLCFHTTQPCSLQLKWHHCVMHTPGLNSPNSPIT